MSQHPIVYVEFSANDPQAAARFYGDLFGWAITSRPQVDYATFDTGAGVGGGFPRIGGPAGTQAGDVLLYVATDDIDATLARAESLGAKLLSPKTEITNQGWYGLLQDPSGNRIAVWTEWPAPAAK